MSVRSEMNELFDNIGSDVFTVHHVISWAKENPDSALYRELKFDDDASAAHLWRLHHSRVLIAVYLTDDKGERKTISLSIDRVSLGGYRDLDAVAHNKDLHEIALADALHELERVELKYEHIQGLEKVWREAEKVRAKTKRGARDGRAAA